ncbi:hypothetical protein CSPX01_17155 [Colletotrichum filicis]|nr:hypothetical protein CSPX01_17155 [Colletotrichum filicis]
MFEPAPAWLTSRPGVFLVSWLLHVSSTLSFACSWDWLLDKFRPKGVNSLCSPIFPIPAKSASIPYLWTLDQSIDPSVKRPKLPPRVPPPGFISFSPFFFSFFFWGGVLRYSIRRIFLLSRFTFPESYENLGACRRRRRPRRERNPTEIEKEREGKISSHNPQANFQSNRTTADCPSYIVRGRHSRKISNRTLFRSCSSLLPAANPIRILGYHTKGALSPPPPSTHHGARQPSANT